MAGKVFTAVFAGVAVCVCLSAQAPLQTKEGSKTDRGRVYIRYGPPDEIDSHPGESYQRPPEEGGGTSTVYPFERWRYRRIEGLGEAVFFDFVDRSQQGDYRLLLMGNSLDRAELQSSPGVISQRQAFGPADGLSVRVNLDRTLSILMSGNSGDEPEKVSGKIADGEGEAVEVFEDSTLGGGLQYMRWVGTPLRPGPYSLAVRTEKSPGEPVVREISFEVK